MVRLLICSSKNVDLYHFAMLKSDCLYPIKIYLQLHYTLAQYLSLLSLLVVGSNPFLAFTFIVHIQIPIFIGTMYTLHRCKILALLWVHGVAVVTHLPPTFEVCSSNPEPYVGMLAVGNQ